MYNNGLALVAPRITLVLDPSFCPAVPPNRAFRALVRAVTNPTPVGIALDQMDGNVSHFDTEIFPKHIPKPPATKPRSVKKQIPMCSLQPLTCLQVQALPRQGMVGPSSDSRPWPGENLVGASSAVNGRACRRRRASGGDWPAALANVQAATLRENCRPEIASSSEANEEGKFGTAE